jgi:glucose-6-phosphate isomerase
MLYEHDIDGCLSARIGEHGLPEERLAATVAEAAPALDELRRHRDDGSLPLLRLPAARGDLRELRAFADRITERFRTVVVLGIGGSSLGTQTLIALNGPDLRSAPGHPHLVFLDNIDPHSFDLATRGLDLTETGFVAVSKSGETAETMIQLLICIGMLRDRLGDDAVEEHVVIITEPADNPMRRLAARFAVPVLDHDPNVGGRFSVLSLVGLLPAMIAGVDEVGVRQGAAEVLDACLGARAPGDAAPVVGAALNVAMQRERGVANAVLMPYVDRLAQFGLWFRQLWAESLGKEGKGTTPLTAAGATDQHSQLQLYLDGPRDKLFTLIILEVAGCGPRVDPELASDPALAYLGGRAIGDLMEAEQRATVATLIDQGRPTRLFRLPRLDETVLGGLLMHFMLETMVAAHLWRVDAFDQPAVDQSKVLARRFLQEL